MPEHEIRVTEITSVLENATRLGRILLFPEVSAYEASDSRLRTELVRRVKKAFDGLPLAEVHRRQLAGEPEVKVVSFSLDPPSHRRSWSLPLNLRFHAICWDHGDIARIAYVPELDIEVVVPAAVELDPRVEQHIRSALQRREPLNPLAELVWLQRCRSLKVEAVSVRANIPTLNELARRSAPNAQRSVLEEVATDLTRTGGLVAFEMDEVVLRMSDCLARKHPQSVVLVGPSGAGKTAAVYELVRQRKALQLESARFWSTSGARLVAGMTGFGQWQERCHALCQEAARTGAVVHLGNLMELMQVGQYVGNDRGVGHFLSPYLARGELVAIVECTPEQLSIMERDAPDTLDALAKIDVPEPSVPVGRSILRQAAKQSSAADRLGKDALATLDRLHRRYATYSAYPGRPLRFLHNLLADTAAGVKLSAADVTRAFSRETGLPLWMLEESDRLDLAATRQWFSRRVMGQSQAVDLVVDLLATIKAGLTKPGRPIASLLFIGPTGVGKTEMAKALAEFLYQDPGRITRIDMSEYGDFASLDRLLGISWHNEGLLTAKVREQPFGVVLLDEFEKAHPRIFDLLLQVLGEGRLTDAAGRLADFRNAVVIMTSNLGAESFGRHAVGFRESHEAFMAAAEHFTREVRDFLRPELFNRIDRIVSFLPLDEDTLLALARRELDLLRQREGIRYRDVCLDYADEAVHELVGLGCDPRYGARPLKRAVDRHVLAPLAAAMNDYAADTPLTAFVGGKGGEIRVAVKSRPPAESAPTKPGPGDVSPNDLANQVLRFRREASALWHSEPLTAVQNELYRLEREQQRANRRRRDRAVSPRRLIDVANLKRLREGCAAVLARAKAIEDEFLLACYTGGTYDAAAILDGLAAGGAEFHSSVIELYRREHDDTDAITVVVYGSDLAWNFMLAETYLNLARKRQCAVQAYEIGLSGKDSPSDSRTFPLKAAVSDEPRSRKKADQPVLVASLIPEPEGFLGNPREGLIGIALRFQGLVARPIFEPEAGLHEFLVGKRRERVLVDCSTALIQEYEPPPKIERKEGISLQPVRRSYQLARRTIDDRLTGSSTRWSGEDFGPAVMRLAEDRFLSHLRSWLAR